MEDPQHLLCSALIEAAPNTLTDCKVVGDAVSEIHTFPQTIIGSSEMTIY